MQNILITVVSTCQCTINNAAVYVIICKYDGTTATAVYVIICNHM